MLLAHVGDAARYGRVEISDTGWILGLHEKDGLSTPGLINAGKYIVQKEWIESIPAGRAVSLEREVFPDWVRRGFLGVESGAPFVDIGTPSSLVEGHQLFRDIESSSRAGDR
jgi:mannose-1-phosphate guanylyltransferase